MQHEAVNKAFLINRQGKDFVLFAGLLDAAHRSGLRSVQTRLIQAPTDANGNLAIVEATTTFVDAQGVEYHFSGLGDASPSNVGRMIAPHLCRMGETRAVARALRLALNIGAVSVEELAEDDPPITREPAPPANVTPMRQPQQTATQQQRPVAQPQQTQPQRQQTAPDDQPPDSARPATEQQVARLAKLRASLGQPFDEAATRALSVEAAAQLITDLVQSFNAQARGGRR